LYSGLVFHGIGLVPTIKAAFVQAIEAAPSGSWSDLVGADAAAMTAEPWPA
jgi:dihydroorotate dehydrogenase